MNDTDNQRETVVIHPSDFEDGENSDQSNQDSTDEVAKNAPPNAEVKEPETIQVQSESEEDLPPTDDVEETVTLCVLQVNYSTEYLSNDKQRPIIHLFCRDEDRNFVQVDVHGFRPYMYVPENEVQKAKQKQGITDVEYNHTSIRGKNLARVYADVPRTIGNIRDDFDHYEADILFPDRFLIDIDNTAKTTEMGITSGVEVPANWESDDRITVRHEDIESAECSVQPRVHTVDIEVEDRNGFPDAEDAEEPIICITSHDSYDDEYVVWSLNPDSESNPPEELTDYTYIQDEREHIPSRNTDQSIRVFESEEALLNDYLKYFKRTDPDLITGWNLDDFDMPYLLNRIEKVNKHTSKYDIDYEEFSRIGEIWGGGWRGPNIKGRVVFDLLYAYKRTQFTELESYRLEYVGQLELDTGKEHFDGDIGDLWESDPKRLIEYNIRDVEICVELDRKQEIIDFWDEVRKFTGCRFEDAPTPGNAVDMLVLQKLNRTYALASKGKFDGEEDYEGGAVFEPSTGIKENVSVLDLKSLYPLSMVTINASPETKVSEDYDGETYTAPNGIEYRKDKDGVMRSMIEELLEERETKKTLRNEQDPETEEYKKYDRQQSAVKVIMNSLYGTLGWSRFRLYDKENAAAVTATGREVIKYTNEVVQDSGKEVIYGDTDSVMIQIPDISVKEGIKISQELESHINEAYDTFAVEELNAEDHRFKIEFEKFYKRFLQAGKKKRYAGHIVHKEGKKVDSVDITGFEQQRSDTAGITGESQKKVITMLVKGADESEVIEYLRSLIDDVKTGNVPVEDIGIPGGFNKLLGNYDTDTAHVRGAKYANLVLDTNLGKGSKPKRLYLSRVHPDFYQRIEQQKGITPQNSEVYAEFKRNPDVICFIHEEQIPAEMEPDWSKMITKTLTNPLSRVLEATDITWEEVKSGNVQTGIEQFM